MTLRSDHVAGAVFVGFGLVILAASGELPFGRLSMPGAGFMPTLLAWLMVILGAGLALRGRESAPLAEIGWDDFCHALSVIAVAGAAIAAYEYLGFILTMFLMMLALLLLVEQRRILPAAIFSAVV